MKWFASTVLTILMLAHAFGPALPFYLCTEDDGSHARGMQPCCPRTSAHPEASYPILEHACCCELTSPMIIDAQPPVRTDYAQRIASLAIIPVANLPALLLPAPLSATRPCHGHPVLRGPPLPLRSVLRI